MVTGNHSYYEGARVANISKPLYFKAQQNYSPILALCLPTQQILKYDMQYLFLPGFVTQNQYVQKWG